MSEILLDPDFTDPFVVLRRQEVLGANGRNSFVTTSYPSMGVITPASSNDLKRLDDYQTGTRYLKVVTQFHLQLPTPGYQADVVQWRGDNFVVTTLDPYPQFGPGWFEAVVGSIDQLEQPL